jgi:hypothetical protein
VLAQGTITPEPIFKTPTPKPTDFYDCPQPGEMEGFGEETPSVSWMMNCGLCLSTQMATVIPSPMPTLEGTPGTPGPTPTGTGGFQPGVQDISIGAFGDGVSGRPSLITGYEITGETGSFAFGYTGYCARDWFGEPEPARCDIECSAYIDGYKVWFSTTGIGGTYYGNLSGGQTVPFYFGSKPDEIGILEVECTVWPYTLDVYSWLNVTDAEGYSITVLSGGAEPTPITDNSYCGSIDSGTGGGSDPFNAEDVFTIPVPLLGQANCIVLMPEFTLPVTAINIIPGINIENDLSFPGATLCVRALTLGTLKILGMAIDLDFYAVLVGAMMILRKVLRS